MDRVAKRLHEDGTKADEDDRAQDRPDHPDGPRAGVHEGFASQLYQSIQVMGIRISRLVHVFPVFNDLPTQQVDRLAKCQMNRLPMVFRLQLDRCGFPQ